MSGRRSGRTPRFYLGMVMALSGYTSMIFSAALGVGSSLDVQIAQVGAIFFVLGAIIMLVSPSE